MKSYVDPNCNCHRIVDEINHTCDSDSWNKGEACDQWHIKRKLLIDNDIEDQGDDYCYCLTCGRIICNHCSKKGE